MPLLPKATAIWLIENTTLTFGQIADFCDMHTLEVQAIADNETAAGMAPVNPIEAGQLDLEEIERCQEDPAARLKLKRQIQYGKVTKKGGKYTPVAKRQDKPNGIAWLLKNHPELSDAQVCRLLGTTKKTVNSIRDRTHRSSATLQATHPVILGLCSDVELQKALAKAQPKSAPDTA